MKLYSPLGQTALITTLLSSTAAFADVTAGQVWDNWSEQMGIYGQGFTTDGETMSGDTLTVANVRIEMTDEDASVLAELGDIMLTENGDGTVTIVTADNYPITLNTTPTYGDPSTVNMTVTQDGLQLTVSGDPEAMNYAFTADSYSIAVDSIEGAAAEEVTLADAMVALMNLSGSYTVNEDNLTRVAYDLNVGAVDFDLNFKETGGNSYVKATADLADLAMAANIATPLGMDWAALDETEMPPFNEGLAMDGGYTFGAMQYAFDFNIEREGAASGTVIADGGEVSVGMDIDGLHYSGAARGLDMNVLFPEELPFPIEATLAEYGFDLAIPLSQGQGGPRDARFAMNLTELAVSDGIWSMIDPQQILPREAVTVAVDLDAKVTPFFDFLDPAQQEAAMMSDVPGELNNVTLNALTVKGAGAEITGNGAFTFDNSDLETFDGMPRPEGQVDLAINGVNGLVDNLIEMGLIPAEEAMMPRMMMGMFATPVGDDMLTSTIEVNSEGHVLANGQRLR